MRARFAPSALRSAAVRQFVKYGLVGVANTLLYMLVYAVCVRALGVWYVAAAGLAYTVGAVNSYLLNRSWTFRTQAGHRVTMIRYTIVQVGGLLGNLALVYLFVDGAGLDKLVGQAVAIVVVVMATFAANRRWTFADAVGGPPWGHGDAPRAGAHVAAGDRRTTGEEPAPAAVVPPGGR